MYIPDHFRVDDPAWLQQVLEAHPLGVLITHGAEGLDANHLPFLFDPTVGPLGRLQAHVARANPVWEQCRDGADVLVVFRGHEHYVSPNWYPSKSETHRVVPTWNYEAVHVHGRLTVHDDEKTVRAIVARLTNRHEAAESVPWTMGSAPAEYLSGMLASIVGIEVAVTRVEAKAKLSQNRERRDREGAAQALRERGQEPLATAMERPPH